MAASAGTVGLQFSLPPPVLPLRSSCRSATAYATLSPSVSRYIRRCARLDTLCSVPSGVPGLRSARVKVR